MEVVVEGNTSTFPAKRLLPPRAVTGKCDRELNGQLLIYLE